MGVQSNTAENILVEIWSKSNVSIIAGVLGLLYIFYTREATPLRKIPGPFIASITKLWNVQQSRGFKRPLVDIALHKKYGPIVRTAPHEILVSSPKSFRIIYGAGSNFSKGDWYIGTSDCGWRGPDVLDLLPEQNMKKYRIQRRVIGPAYTESAMKDLEPNLDAVLKKDFAVMHQRAGESVDADLFFNMLVSDCLTMMTFSKSKDLVEAGSPDELILAIQKAWYYIYLVGYFPWVHRTMTYMAKSGSVKWFRNAVASILAWTRGEVHPKTDVQSLKVAFAGMNPFEFHRNLIAERLAESKESKPAAFNTQTDIAGKLLALQSEKSVLPDRWVISMALVNFGAGVETTAIVISCFLNNVLSNPGCQERIIKEIDEARKEGKLNYPPKLREMKENLPLLSACLHESLRLHNVIGFPLYRKVPKEGVELEGYWLPGGTEVAINPWVLSRDKTLYGEDAEIWRPERWLEYSPEKTKYLETYSIIFGTGARSCPGKYLAQAVYTKVIPMLFMDLEWSFTNPEVEKVLQCTFSVRYMDLQMKWKKRERVV